MGHGKGDEEECRVGLANFFSPVSLFSSFLQREKVDVMWRKKVEDLRQRILAEAGEDDDSVMEQLPPLPSLTVLVPKPKRGRPARKQPNTLWSGTNKHRDVSTGPLARAFALLLAPLTHSLALPCLLHLCAHSFVRLLTYSLLSSLESE